MRFFGIKTVLGVKHSVIQYMHIDLFYNLRREKDIYILKLAKVQEVNIYGKI